MQNQLKILKLSNKDNICKIKYKSLNLKPLNYQKYFAIDTTDQHFTIT